MEQRQNIRTAVFAPVGVIAQGQTHHDLIKDISPGGAYIESSHKLPLGETLVLAFTYPSYPQTITLDARVVRKDRKGFGIQFSAVPSGPTGGEDFSLPAIPPRAADQRHW